MYIPYGILYCFKAAILVASFESSFCAAADILTITPYIPESLFTVAQSMLPLWALTSITIFSSLVFVILNFWLSAPVNSPTLILAKFVAALLVTSKYNPFELEIM